MIFLPHLPPHLEKLRQWLAHLDTLFPMNGQFDLLYLRTIPRLRPVLQGHHTIIDLSVLNYQEDELRPERSLKTIGNVIGTHSYSEEHRDRTRRYPSCHSPALHHYNGVDTHSTLLSISEIAKRILSRYGPSSPKLSPLIIQFYSRTIWLCIRMAESGIPMDRNYLERLEQKLLSRLSRIESICAANSLQLGGPGSELSKKSFIDRILSLPPPVGLPELAQHPGLVRTPKKQAISFDEENRKLFAQYTPPGTLEHTLLEHCSTYSHFQKLISSYLFPLLRHTRNHPDRRRSILIPKEIVPWRFTTQPGNSPASSLGVPTSSDVGWLALLNGPGIAPAASSAPTAPSVASTPPTTLPVSVSGVTPTRTTLPSPDIQIAYPTWFPIPSSVKDDQGGSGGTLQSRITCKDPAAQTFPDPIQRAIRSRNRGGSIWKFDLSQIELRVAALLSGDEGMCAAYRTADPDLHTDVAVHMFTVPYLVNKYGEGWRRNPIFRKSSTGERQVGKHTGFGDLFLASDETMQSTVREMSGVEIPLEFFTRMVLSRPTRRPGLWAWQQSLLREARDHGFISVPITGHTRLFPHFQYTEGSHYPVGSPQWWKQTCSEKRKHEAVNFPIQTFAASVLLSIQHTLHELLPPLNHTSPWVHMFKNDYDAAMFDTTPNSERRLRDVIEIAFTRERESGLWYLISQHLGRTVRLDYELSQVS